MSIDVDQTSDHAGLGEGVDESYELVDGSV